MNKDRIEIVYQVLINNLELTTETLTKYGLTNEEIESFVSVRVIEPTKNNTYKLVSIEKFRQYGVKLLQGVQIQKAGMCFKKCYELAPTARNIALQFLLSQLSRRNYEEAFEIFANLEKQRPEKYQKDNNLYLYLLSIITDSIPLEYQERTRKLNSEDIILTQAICNKVENEIRIAISQHKFKYAYQLIKNRNLKETEYSVKYEVIKTLVTQAIGVTRKLRASLLELTKKEDYNEIITILNKIQQKRGLSKFEKAILLISETIINIINYQIIPTSNTVYTCDLYEAIEENDFKLALDLNKQYLDYHKEDESRNIIYLLLSKLNSLIEEQEKQTSLQDDFDIIEEQTIDSIQIEEQGTSDVDLEDIETLAYYISSQNIPIEIAIKQAGLFHEQGLLVKLIYARDYYIESNYKIGDQIVKEVENSVNKTPKVLSLLQNIKSNRDNYKEQFNPHKRSLVPKTTTKGGI